LGTPAAWISGLLGLMITVYIGFHWKQWFKADSARFKGADSSTSLIYLFFFMAFLTHVFIDVCTTYGTQIFYPFTLYRASFHNIFVVDPLYTLPLLLGIVGVVRWGRISNTLGLILSSGYMLFTFWNAAQVKQAASTALRQNQIEVERLIATPSPMNNVLWNIVAEGDNEYYLMEYHSGTEEWGKMKTIAKYQESILPELKAVGVGRLIWFSDGFYTLQKLSEKEYVFKDLRFAFHSQDRVDTGFGFRLLQTDEGKWQVEEVRDQEGLINVLEQFRAKLWNGIPTIKEG
jgi:inner membrane protein